MPTTATSHRTRATLQQVAQSHASSRALSATTRDYFRRILAGDIDVNDGATLEGVQDAFFEAATSCATRAGQSMARRAMVSDLMALRTAVLAGQDIRPVTHTLTVKVQGDADALRRALLDLHDDSARVVFVSNPTTSEA